MVLLALMVYLMYGRPEVLNEYLPMLSAEPTPPVLEKFSILSVPASELPKTLRIVSDETFAIENGKGSVTARAGSRVGVVSRRGEILEISYLGGAKQVHYTKTSLADDVQAARMKKGK